MRDERLDILRFVGIAMIILAHSVPPPAIFQFRNFDVPLMVLVAGASFGLSYKGEPFRSYVWKRIKRMLFPVWIFLMIEVIHAPFNIKYVLVFSFATVFTLLQVMLVRKLILPKISSLQARKNLTMLLTG